MKQATGLTRIVATSAPWPLHDAAASRHVEQRAAEGLPAHALMERAGLAVAKLALALHPQALQVQVWAGPGNNGGDGLVAARHLQAAGRRVSVCLLGQAERLPPDAQAALQRAIAAQVPVSGEMPDPHGTCDLAIDALLGLGARRAPTADLALAIAAMNAHGAPILAVDIPSGLHPDTGALLGAAAVRATATLALLTLKPGNHTAQGRDHAGDVWLDALDVPSVPPTAWLSGTQPQAARLHGSHKGSYGDVVVVGGAEGMVGAAWLAARAASTAGAGRVICSPLAPDAAHVDARRPELMGRRDWWRSPPATLASATVVCGCGGGSAVEAALAALLAHCRQLVLDADALNAISRDVGLQQRLRARNSRGLASVLTPHPLEGARLLGISAAEVQSDRLRAAQALATRFECVVVLKGSGSIIAAPGQLPRINATGNGALANAGTGDVLAGWIGGLWAQAPSDAAADVAAAAVAAHGAAADDWMAAGHRGPLRASDLIEALATRRD